MSDPIAIECDHFDELWPGRFVKGGNLKGPTHFKIVSVAKYRESRGDLRVIVFEPIDGIEQREMKLPKTNALALVRIFGTGNLKEWRGRTFTAQPGKVEHGQHAGKTTIRVCGSPELEEDIPDFIVDLGNPFIKPFVMPLKSYKQKDKQAPKREDDGPGDPQLADDIAAILAQAEDKDDLRRAKEVLINARKELNRAQYEALKQQGSKRAKEIEG